MSRITESLDSVKRLQPAERVKVFAYLRGYCTQCGYGIRPARAGSKVCECNPPRPVYETRKQGL